MDLHVLDWALILGYALFALIVGLVLRKRAGEGLEQYFLSGRTLPWWIAGTSMVATTFASDTPLVISGLVRTQGKRELDPRRVCADPPVGTLWVPFLPPLEPYSETLLGNNQSVFGMALANQYVNVPK